MAGKWDQRDERNIILGLSRGDRGGQIIIMVICTCMAL